MLHHMWGYKLKQWGYIALKQAVSWKISCSNSLLAPQFPFLTFLHALAQYNIWCVLMQNSGKILLKNDGTHSNLKTHLLIIFSRHFDSNDSMTNCYAPFSKSILSKPSNVPWACVSHYAYTPSYLLWFRVKQRTHRWILPAEMEYIKYDFKHDLLSVYYQNST